MKTRSIIISICIFVFIAAVFLGYKGSNPGLRTSSRIFSEDLEQLVPVEVKVGSLNIMVDPRIELLISVQLNSDYSRLTQFEPQYKSRMQEYFKSFKKHAAVSNFRSPINI